MEPLINFVTMTNLYFLRPFVSLLLPLSLMACQNANIGITKSLRDELDNELLSCMERAVEFRQTVAAQQATDASAPAVNAFPLLHSNRFLSHTAQTIESDAQRQEWIGISGQLGQQIRRNENQNLRAPWSQDSMTNLGNCADHLATSENLRELRQELIESVEPLADHYAALPQWLGFNWLLRPIFRWRILQLHEEEQQWFEQPQEFEKTVSYEIASDSTLGNEGAISSAFVKAYEVSPLALPTLDDEPMQALFEMHAPKFFVEFKDSNDLIGAPAFAGDNVVLDTTRPTVYTLPSYTEFGDSNLLQLNYVVWFSERKASGWPDLYAGTLDSLIWRVTLDERGNILLYDSIHSCGCYHKYFIASKQVSKRLPAWSDEPANIFNLPIAGEDSKSDSQPISPSIFLTANEHYVVGVEFKNTQASRQYTLESYHKLTNLPGKTEAASLFSATGIINPSKRLERFTLWPTGIESVGAMRQWGTHATGFVQQQQFDDAALLDNYFIRTNE